MLNNKTLAITFTAFLLAGFASANLEFRDPNPANFYTGVDMNENNLTGLPNPSMDSEALNLGYADSLYLQRNGDSLEGDLDMDGNYILNLPSPITGDQAATKAYVDNQISGGVTGSQNLSQVLEKGAEANQSINMANNTITGLKSPGGSEDALNLGYANSLYLQRNGDSMNGNLDLKSNTLMNADAVKGPGGKINFTSNAVLFQQEGLGTVLNISETGEIKLESDRRLNMSEGQLVVPTGDIY